MDNVMVFLLDYWKPSPIPKYLQVDNGMCFAGDYKHPMSFSRFVRLALCVGIEEVFIAPSKPWMSGTIEGFNKGFDKRFWQKELFIDLKDIRKKSKTFFETENENLKVREINKFGYEIGETVHNHKNSIFRSSL